MGMVRQSKLQNELHCATCGTREDGWVSQRPLEGEVRRLLRRLCIECARRRRRAVRRALPEHGGGSLKAVYQVRCLCCGELSRFESTEPDERELRYAIGSAYQAGLGHCRLCT